MYQNEMKEKAKKVNIIDFLREPTQNWSLKEKTEALRTAKIRL